MKVATLWGQVCSRLPVATNTYSPTKLLSVLEILMSSGLESKHKTIVNATITLWNSTFGTCQDNLEYPTRVADILLRLRPIADIDLPSFPHSLETEVSAEHRQPPTFPETQEDGMDFVNSPSLDPALPANTSNGSLRHQPISSGPTRVSRSSRSIRPRDRTPESSKRKPKKPVSTPKLRHNDSQIQFETIESSPIANALLDSQLFTDRQKEVKERQKAQTAAMFPDIRSTPLSKADSVQRRLSSVSSSGGLSLHRSASKTRLLAPTNIERQTTPEPLGEFDAFLHSSPTPTRSLQAGVDINDLPSSPPERPKSRVADSDIPSSPPEPNLEPNFDSNITEQPAAQINPFDRTISTFDLAESDKDNNMLDGSTGPQNPRHAQTVMGLSSSVIGTDVVESDSMPILQDDAGASKAPSTPKRLQKLPEVEQQTPKTPVFHDALESPIVPSSDKQTVDDKYEDAVSSPKLQPERNKSSPFSDFDQSGMMKLMAGYDQGSGRPRTDLQTSKDDQAVTIEESDQPAEDRLNPSGNHGEFQISEQPYADRKDTKASFKVQVSSSLASVIPETPGTRVPRDWIIVDDARYDPEDTIVVDVPDDIEEFPKPGKKRKFSVSPRKRYSVFVEIPSRKKLKLENGGNDADLVPESQLTSSQRKQFYISMIIDETDCVKESQPEKSTPTKKRRSRGRPSRNSATTSQTDASQQVDIIDNLSSADTSANLEASMQSQEDSESDTDAPKLNGEDLTAADGMDMDNEIQDISMGRENGLSAEELIDEPESPTRPEEKIITSEMGVEISIEAPGDSPMDGADDASTLLEAEYHEYRAPETVPGARVELSRNTIPTKMAQVDASMQTEHVAETITSTSMAKSYLQNIVNFFSGATLTKEQAAAYEDQLDDAKEQLFGAKRRGRELS